MSDGARAAAEDPAAVTREDDANDISVPRAVTVEIEGPEDPTEAGGNGSRGDRRSRTQIKTVRLDSRDFRPSWPIAIASLEQLSGWAVLALRLGTLALIQQCIRELSEEDARADLIVRLRALTDALAHMPLET